LHLFSQLSNIETSSFVDVFSTTCNFNLSCAQFNTSESESSNTSTWVISAPLNHTIGIKFETFQLSDSQKYGHNWIKIYDGRRTNNASLGVFTGVRRPFMVQSSGQFMLVKLIKGLHLTSLCNFTGVCSLHSTKGKFLPIWLFFVGILVSRENGEINL